jgi:cyclopropane fatty-acyl-phospholipid synthase-like methyltransferase
MGFYDSIENVKMYIKMAEGYDGQLFYDLISKYLNNGASVLELGSGEGKDIELFSSKYIENWIGITYSRSKSNIIFKT